MDVAAASPNIYLQDLVSFGRFFIDRGLVAADAEVYNASLPVDTFQILRVDGSVVHKSAADISVADRSHLHPGQVVGSASDIAGQLGVVTGVTTVLDIGLGMKVIRGVSPSSLRRVRRFNLGDFVVSGTWLGRVVEVSIDIDVLFDDGAVCRVANAESTMLKVMKNDTSSGYTNYRRQMNSLFYPGQRVTGVDPASLFKAARWLTGYWNLNRLVGTIIKVETSGVLVYWIASAHYGTDPRLVEASAPPAYQNPDDVAFFCAASNCSWGVNDRCFFREPTSNEADVDGGGAASSHDHVEEGEEEEEWEEYDDYHNVIANDREAPTSRVAPPSEQQQGVKIYRKQLRKVFFERHRRARRPQVRRNVELEIPMVVANSRTSVDVLWQDGTWQHGRPSATIVPFGIMNEQEFFPGQHVSNNTLPIDGATSTTSHDETTIDGSGSTKRVGVVTSLNCKDHTVCVSWFKAAVRPDEAREVECDDIVSVYDLKRDSAHSAYYGDVVIRLLPSGSTNDENAQFHGNNKKNAVAADISWVGRVVDLPHGHVQVKWGDGSISTALPHEIVVVREEHYVELWTEMGEWMEDDGILDAPQELAAANTDNDLRNAAANSEVDEPASTTTTTTLLGSAVQSLLRLTSDVMARSKGFLTDWRPTSSSLPSSELPAPANVSSDGNEDAVSFGATETSAGAVTKNDADADGHHFTKEEMKAADATCCYDESISFPQFDVLHISPPDHHYLDTTDQGGSRGKNWAKKVQKEWKILENDLPETIYVRVFEDRMDLLRVMMVGASETPYNHGLFFFDLQLPPSYPAAPPQVYYHSFGLRLNPNLYESGTVCLSLLNTFGGEDTEVWLPTTSSLLQVVVSIQGLVLNDKPYYNEAGYETLLGTLAGRRNALPYDENVYLLTLRTMLHLLRRPPQGFEGFVKDHFCRRGRLVLMTCEAYLQGCVDCTMIGDSIANEAGRERPCSTGLKLALANMIPSLVAAFTEIGAEGCERFQKLRAPLPCAVSTAH